MIPGERKKERHTGEERRAGEGKGEEKTGQDTQKELTHKMFKGSSSCGPDVHRTCPTNSSSRSATVGRVQSADLL